MTWRARQRRKAILRWMFSLLLIGLAGGLGLWVALGVILESVIRSQLEKAGISCPSIQVVSWSPWFLELRLLHLQQDAWSLHISQLQVDLLPWKIVQGKVENLHLSGVDVRLKPPPANSNDPPGMAFPLPLPDFPFQQLFLQDAQVHWTQGDHTLHGSLQGHIDATRAPWQVSLQMNGETIDGQGGLRLSKNGEGQLVLALHLTDLPSILRLWPESDQQLQFLPNMEMAPLELDVYTTLQELQPTRLSGTLHTPSLLWRQNDRQIQTSGLAAAVSWTVSHPPQAQVLLQRTHFADAARGLLASAEETTLSLLDDSLLWVIPSLHLQEASTGQAHLSLSGSIKSWANPQWQISAAIDEACWRDFSLQPLTLIVDGDFSSLNGQLDRLVAPAWDWITAHDVSFTAKNLQTAPEFEASATMQLHAGNQSALELSLWSAGLLPPTGLPKFRAALTNRKADFHWLTDSFQVHGSGGCNLEVTWQDDLLQANWDGTLGRMTFQFQDWTGAIEELIFGGTTTPRSLAELSAMAGESVPDWPIWMELVDEAVVQGGSFSIQDLLLNDWEVALQRDRPIRQSASLLVQSAQYQNHVLSRVAADLATQESGWKISANGLYGTDQVPFAVEAELAKEGRLQYEAVCQTHTFSQSPLLQQLVPGLGDLLISGRYSVQSIGHLQEANLLGSVLCRVEEGSFSSQQTNLDIFGIDTQLEFQIDQGVINRTEQCVTFASLSSEKLQLSQGQLCFQLLTPTQLKVSRLEFEFLGAHWLAVPFAVDLETLEYTMAFAVVGMDLVELSELLPELQLRMAGIADGVLSIGFKNKQPVPQPGYLEMRPGLTGKIKYLPKGWLAGAPSDSQNLGYLLNASVESALDDFDVENMRIEVQPNRENPSHLRIQLVASGSGYGSGLKTRLPIGSFTVNFQLPWEEIMNLSLLRLLSTGKLQLESGN